MSAVLACWPVDVRESLLSPSLESRLHGYGDHVEVVTLFGGQRVEIDCFQISPGDWLAKDAENDSRISYGTTMADARDNLIERIEDELGSCPDCRCGFECVVCDIEEAP